MVAGNMVADNTINTIESRVKAFIEKNSMMGSEDKIICAVSGGKDSTVLLYILSRLFPGSVQAVTFDPHIPDYSKTNIDNISGFCKKLSIDLHIISIKDLLGLTLAQAKEKIDKDYKQLNYCTICGILKRYYLNRFARENSFTVIATGHNADDAAQSFLMNLMKGHNELSARIGPVSGMVKHDLFVKKVKPLFTITEHEIKTFSEEMGFPVFYGSCPYSKTSYRNQVRDHLWRYESAHQGSIKRCVDLFLELYPYIQHHFSSSGQPQTCSNCGEPSKGKICSACELIRYLV